MIKRLILPEARLALNQFRALCITGPRQSGKTTLARQLFRNKPYLSFENPETQQDAEVNPSAFLAKYKQGAILDEVQRVPGIFRYLQGVIDSNSRRGQFILTGSNNFLLNEKISQSLAGRVGYLHLLPLSFAELKNYSTESGDCHKMMLKGGYPEIWSNNLNADKWLSSYVQAYVQRDVRQLKNIINYAAFNRFIQLCANYAGRILNRDDIARQCGVDTKTILAWIGLLEASFILFRLQPWYKNLNKRIVKSPKIYFYDTGLLCHLLNIKSIASLQKSSNYGFIFENWIISEIKKNRFNAGENPGMYYFRDSTGNEVDLILDHMDAPIAIEIKSGKKTGNEMFRGLKFWQRNSANSQCVLVYGGHKSEMISDQLSILPWHEVNTI